MVEEKEAFKTIPGPETQTRNIGEVPICKLWSHAYSNLRLEDSELVLKYETKLLKDPVYGDSLGIPNGFNNQHKMQEVIKRRQEEIDKNSPKFMGKPLKELAEPVLAVISFINIFVQTALQANPPVAMGWAGVTAFLPVRDAPCKTSPFTFH